MEREQDKIDFDTATIWRMAQGRRKEDIRTWLTNFLERRRLKASDAAAPYPEGHPAPR